MAQATGRSQAHAKAGFPRGNYPGPGGALARWDLKPQHQAIVNYLDTVAASMGATLPALIVSSATEIAAAIGESTRSVQRWMKELAAAGLVVPRERGLRGNRTEYFVEDPLAVPDQENPRGVIGPDPQLWLFNRSGEEEPTPEMVQEMAPPPMIPLVNGATGEGREQKDVPDLAPELSQPRNSIPTVRAPAGAPSKNLPSCKRFSTTTTTADWECIYTLYRRAYEGLYRSPVGPHSPKPILDLLRRAAVLAVESYGADWLLEACRLTRPEAVENVEAYLVGVLARSVWAMREGEEPADDAQARRAKSRLRSELRGVELDIAELRAAAKSFAGGAEGV